MLHEVRYLQILDAGATDEQLAEMAKFVRENLCTDPKGKKEDSEEKTEEKKEESGVVEMSDMQELEY